MPRAVPKPDTNRKTINKGIGGRGGSSAKRSGTYFENAAKDYFDSNEGVRARRVTGSGAFGTMSKDPYLTGDLQIEYDILDKIIIAECKFGYGGKTQVAVKKEWVDKNIEEAKLVGGYPALVIKFKGARGPNSKLICFTWETWTNIMEHLREEVQYAAIEYTGQGFDDE